MLKEFSFYTSNNKHILQNARWDIEMDTNGTYGNKYLIKTEKIAVCISLNNLFGFCMITKSITQLQSTTIFKPFVNRLLRVVRYTMLQLLKILQKIKK